MAGGQVRCGQCGRAFDALQHLHDEPPHGGASDAPAPGGTASPPVLGAPQAPAVLPATTLALDPAPRRGHWPWRVLLVLLLLGTSLHLAWTFRETLLDRPGVRAWLVEHGVPGFESRGPFRDTERLHLVSRDFHAHPTRPGVLVLSATFVNLASQAQPFPVLEVTLMDADHRLLAKREFSPAEYVLPGTDPNAQLPPNVHTPILLEFVDPGEHAVGFELAFH